MNEKETTYNIYFLRGELIVTDDTPHAIYEYIAKTYNLDPEDDDDFERISCIGDELVDIAHDLKIEQVDIAGVTDFAEPNTHAVRYEI